MIKPFMLKEQNWKSVQKTKYSVAVLPWGATEPHNYHLPYATDTLQSEYIAEKACGDAWERGAKVVCLPPIPFGCNTGQLNLPMTINLNPSTQLAIVKDIVASLAGYGVKKLLLLNGHGGNDFKPIIREMQFFFPDVFIGLVNWYSIPNPKEFFDEPGDHAGEMETSIVMYLYPELVLPLEEAGEGKEHKIIIQGFREGWAWTPRRWTQVSEDTGIGNPKRASADKGRRYLEYISRKLADLICEIDKADSKNLYEK